MGGERHGARVAVVGAGAIGSVLASQLHDRGHEVVFCARPGRGGRRIRVDGPLGIGELPLEMYDDPAQANTVDWVVLATKTQDSGGAADWLAALAGEDTTVLVAQNGVTHRERVAPMLSDGATLLPALVYINMEPLGPDHFRHRAGDQLVVEAGPAAERLEDLLSGSALTLTTAEDFAAEAWRKLLGNLAANPLTALTMRRTEVLREPEAAELVRGLISEGIAVAIADGIALDESDLEGTLATFKRFPEDSGSSMLFDREVGRGLESESLNGYVLERGRRLGVPVPFHEAIVPLLRLVRTADAPVR